MRVHSLVVMTVCHTRQATIVWSALQSAAHNLASLLLAYSTSATEVTADFAIAAVLLLCTNAGDSAALRGPPCAQPPPGSAACCL
jgi:hypothetical protein